MTYELDVAPKVQERWGKELNQTERRIRGTVDPEYYPLVLACLIKERKVNHEKEGWTMWVYLGTIEIDLKDSRRQEISLWCTYKDTGAFSVNDGKHSTEYRGGNDLLFTNTLIGIHLVQKEKGK
jgi:hypothetical protein